jgi:hypothetical protein
VGADTLANRAQRGACSPPYSPFFQGARTMFSDIATRVGMCYIGAIIVLASALQLAG